ncbi:hypothetical protein M0R72_10990 [Candidatus Pacearchaeota archaeon]|jgi:DNA-binding transcriptional MerR regulator|nr:hypothetical protein [Candidatus Pacearchaeota archaeon]
MTEPTNPAGTPPAKEPEGGNKPPVDQGKTLTQAEIDEIVKDRLERDRRTRDEALAKDLGMSLKDVKAIIKAKKDADDAQKTELEKLTGERDGFKSEATTAKIEAAKVRALARAGADPEKIDAMLKRVVGSTPEEIEADVLELKNLGLIGSQKPQTAANGAGNPGLSSTPGGQTLEDRIAAAEKAGAYTLATSLKLQLQREKFK